MKSFKNYIVFIILLSFLIFPTFVFAAWWNPSTWNWSILNIFKKPIQTQTIIEKTNPQEGVDNKKGDTDINLKFDKIIENQVGSFNIIYPNGEEVLELGKTYQIKWNKSNYSKNSDVLISLVGDEVKNYKGPKDRSIWEYYSEGIAITKNTGVYNWTVSPKINLLKNIVEAASDSDSHPPLYKPYKIKIFIKQGKSEETYISKEYFRIASSGCTPSWRCSSWSPCGNDGNQWRWCEDGKNCGLKTNMPSFSQKCEQTQSVDSYVKIIFPNGGETFVLDKLTYREEDQGAKIKVSWESNGLRSDAWGYLYLISQDSNYKRYSYGEADGIASNQDIRNGGSFEDKLYGKYPPGKYKIKVVIGGDNGKQYSDESDNYFDIVSE